MEIKRNWKDVETRRKYKNQLNVHISDDDKNKIKNYAKTRKMTLLQYIMFLVNEVEGKC